MKYGRSNDLPPPTIVCALMAQKAFSQGLPLLVMTRIKGYFPLDWVLFIVFGSLGAQFGERMCQGTWSRHSNL